MDIITILTIILALFGIVIGIAMLGGLFKVFAAQRTQNTSARVFLTLGFVPLVILAIVVAYSAPDNAPGGTNADAAVLVSATAVLGLITATAIGIERLLEAFWNLVELTAANAFWPFNELSKGLHEQVEQLDKALAELAVQADTSMQALTGATKEVEAKKEAAQGALIEIQTYITQLKVVAASNSATAVRETIDQLARNVSAVQTTLTNVMPAATLANSAIGTIAELTAKTAANPGRMLISLFISVTLGLLVAWPLGLDMFTAILEHNYSPESIPRLTVALTGIIIGLGSSPTHEAIRALQEYKESKK